MLDAKLNLNGEELSSQSLALAGWRAREIILDARPMTVAPLNLEQFACIDDTRLRQDRGRL
jgi:hypothetical protein